ncbi:major facilitator superfamily transporter [Secundilactobacillus silagincola]|uniref:Major facilitator superfamily transporter n=1 Tax=Secundilactobacillus silagincola TaxID=1714681 RepID=A0A1Z5J1K2_9LACO|nr:MFS transporter [Secundilactobacillus silagincola]GAX07923.1 major facilitator superfamily transporter [Secundilactobacillus silagincola]
MNKYRLQAVVFVLVAFMSGCNEFMVVGILPDIANHLHVSIAMVGYLVTIFATVYAISTPIITILTSKYNRYKTILTLMGIFLIGNTLSGLATNYWMMVASRVISASVSGGIISIIMTFANQIAPEKKRANLISWIYAGFSIASVIGIPVGTTISTHYGWRYAFFTVSIISLITIVFLIWLLPRRVAQTQGSILNQLSLLKDSRIYIAIAVVLFTAATQYGYYTYIRPLLTSVLGFDTRYLNLLLFALGIASVFSNRFSGTIAVHGGLQLMPKYYVTDVIILILLPSAFMNKFIGFSMLMLITMLVTLFSASMQLHFLDVAEHDYPQSMLLASSLSSIFFNFGTSLGSATASFLVGTVGVTKISFGAAIYALFALTLLILLNRIVTKHQRLVNKSKLMLKIK